MIVTMLNDTEILEGAAFAPSEAELVGRKYHVRLIEGDRLGSSGYYPSETLKRDGPRLFKKGTPMYLNHQTPEEKIVRPFGSIQEFAGELAEDAYYENDGLYADIEVFEHQIPLIKSLKDRIGISIRAKGRSVLETINGKSVPVFRELVEARSADFVIKAGAGGKIVSILESATDSETTSEDEEGMTNMDKEILEALKVQSESIDKLTTAIEESRKPVVEEKQVEESAEVDYDKVLEIAEAFVSSTLDAEGRSRVLDLHRATKKPLAELIEAEEAYVKRPGKSAAAEDEGIEESANSEVEESAKDVKLALPSAWKKKDK